VVKSENTYKIMFTLTQIIFKICLKYKLYLVCALIFRIAIKERSPAGGDSFIYSNNGNRNTLLLLDSVRYRGDIDALASNCSFRILHITQGWQSLLKGCLFDSNESLHDIIFAKSNSQLHRNHVVTTDFTTHILDRLYKIIRVDAVITVHFKYIEDYHWALSSKKINVPHIMLYRECNLFSNLIYGYLLNKMKEQKKFDGSHVIVHNEISKKSFLDGKFAKKNQISVCGALRMDGLLSTLKDNICGLKNYSRKKKFVLFYFPYNSTAFGYNKRSLSDGSFWKYAKKLFKELHISIIQLAVENPNIEFIIKPKKEFLSGGEWIFFKKVIEDSNVDVSKLSNYKIEPELNVHNLIINSDVICGMQSSTTVESAVIGKKVIFPLFFNFHDSEFYNDFPWRNYINLFDVATDSLQFKKMVIDAFKEPKISRSTMKKRRALFKEVFGSLKPDSLDKYSKVITEVVNSHKLLNNKN